MPTLRHGLKIFLNMGESVERERQNTALWFFAGYASPTKVVTGSSVSAWAQSPVATIGSADGKWVPGLPAMG